MTDLGDFGVDVDEPEEQETDDKPEKSSNPEYRTGRCRAITVGGDRCSGSIAGRNISDDDPGLCHMHDIQHRVRTIDDTPMSLIEATSRTPWDRLDELDVNADRIRMAVHAIHGLEDMPIVVSEEGVSLPHRHAAADKLVIRTPAMTVQSMFPGDQNVRPNPFPSVGRKEWEDVEPDSEELRNSKCLTSDQNTEQFSIGLKIFGREQEWYPVRFRTPTQTNHEDEPAESRGKRR